MYMYHVTVSITCYFTYAEYLYYSADVGEIMYLNQIFW